MTVPAGPCDNMFWGTRLVGAQARYTANPATYPNPTNANSTADAKAAWEGAKYRLTGVNTPADGSTTLLTVDKTGDAIAWLTTNQWGATFYNGSSTNNGARWWGEFMVRVYCDTRGLMTTAQRTTAMNIITEMVVYDTFYRNFCTGGPTEPNNNYFWAYKANAILWALAIRNEAYTYNYSASITRCNPPAACMVEICNLTAEQISNVLLNEIFNPGKRWGSFINFLNGGAKGGVAPEGSHYGPYLVEYENAALQVMRDYGRDVNTETPYFIEAVWALIYATTPKSTFGRSTTAPTVNYRQIFTYGDEQDNDGYPPAARHAWGDFMTGMVERHSGAPIAGYIREWINQTNPQRISFWRVLDTNLGGAGTPFSELPTRYYAPGSKYLLIRDTWTGDKPTYVLWQMGQYDGGHGKCDAGSFQLLYDQHWLSRNTGSRSQTVANVTGTGTEIDQSIWAHSGVTVNNSDYPSNCSNRFTTVSRLKQTPNWAMAATNLTTYANIAGVTALIREFYWVEHHKTMMTVDRCVATSDLPCTALTFTPFSATRTANLIESTHDDGELRIISLTDDVSGQSVTYSEVNGMSGGASAEESWFRQQIAATGANAKYQINVMQMRGATDSDLSASLAEDGSQFVVTLTQSGQSPTTITIAKGATSSGGTIQIGAGAVEAMPSTVQGIVADLNGVVWEGTAVLPAVPISIRIP